jgi:hypothetical protein
MSSDLEEVARRAVACKHWRWMGGMRVICTPRHDGSTGYFIRLEQDGYRAAQNEYPDLSDPATMGCLLALVREAHNAPSAYLIGLVTKQWVVHHFAEPDAYWKALTKLQPTEASALVAALEAAHNRA